MWRQSGWGWPRWWNQKKNLKKKPWQKRRSKLSFQSEQAALYCLFTVSLRSYIIFLPRIFWGRFFCVLSNCHKRVCDSWNGFYDTQKKDLTNPRNRAMVEMLLRVAFHVILGSGFFHVFFPLPFFSSFFFVSYLPMFQWLTLKTWKKLKKLLQTRAKWAIFFSSSRVSLESEWKMCYV